MAKYVLDKNDLADSRGGIVSYPVGIIMIVALLLGGPAIAEETSKRIDFEIPQQAVATALISFSEQANIQVIVDATVVNGLQSAAVTGSMGTNNALLALLDDTGLSYQFSSESTVTILPDSGDGASDEPDVDDQDDADSDNNPEGNPELDDDSSISDSSSAGSDSMLEEIIVTAQKREESLLRTPLSIAAFTSDLLEKSSITDLYDVAIQTPGMILNKEIVGKIYIRGIGAENLTIGGDPGVAVHADGAYIARTSAANFDLYDVERVEVLRGPQGTLYGRNATGGTINIISNRPTPEFEGSFFTEFGDFNHVRVGGVLSGPLVEDKIFARVAIVKGDRDGFTPNLFTGGRPA